MDPVHVARILYKVTKWKDNSIYATQAMGLYYIPLGTEHIEEKRIAEGLGGWDFNNLSTKDMEDFDKCFKRFPEAGVYHDTETEWIDWL